MPTFKEIFSKKERVSPGKGSPNRGSPGKARSPERRMGPQELLSSSQALLQRLRTMQPGDDEAFPMLNECTRLMQQLGIEVGKILPTETQALWRMQLHEMQSDLANLTSRILSSANIADVPSGREAAMVGGLDDDLFSGLSVASEPATAAPAAPVFRQPSPTLNNKPGVIPVYQPGYQPAAAPAAGHAAAALPIMQQHQHHAQTGSYATPSPAAVTQHAAYAAAALQAGMIRAGPPPGALSSTAGMHGAVQYPANYYQQQQQWQAHAMHQYQLQQQQQQHMQASAAYAQAGVHHHHQQQQQQQLGTPLPQASLHPFPHNMQQQQPLTAGQVNEAQAPGAAGGGVSPAALQAAQGAPAAAPVGAPPAPATQAAVATQPAPPILHSPSPGLSAAASLPGPSTPAVGASDVPTLQQLAGEGRQLPQPQQQQQQPCHVPGSSAVPELNASGATAVQATADSAAAGTPPGSSPVVAPQAVPEAPSPPGAVGTTATGTLAPVGVGSGPLDASLFCDDGDITADSSQAQEDLLGLTTGTGPSAITAPTSGAAAGPSGAMETAAQAPVSLEPSPGAAAVHNLLEGLGTAAAAVDGVGRPNSGADLGTTPQQQQQTSVVQAGSSTAQMFDDGILLGELGSLGALVNEASTGTAAAGAEAMKKKKKTTKMRIGYAASQDDGDGPDMAEALSHHHHHHHQRSSSYATSLASVDSTHSRSNSVAADLHPIVLSSPAPSEASVAAALAGTGTGCILVDSPAVATTATPTAAAAAGKAAPVIASIAAGAASTSAAAGGVHVALPQAPGELLVPEQQRQQQQQQVPPAPAAPAAPAASIVASWLPRKSSESAEVSQGALPMLASLFRSLSGNSASSSPKAPMQHSSSSSIHHHHHHHHQQQQSLAAAGPAATVEGLDAYLGSLAGPAWHQAEAAAHQQQQVMAALGERKAAAAARALGLGQKRQDLLMQRAEAARALKELEAKQAKAVEVEDFDTAAALDGEMEELRNKQAAASAALGQCEAEMETLTQQRQQLAELQAALLERLGTFFASLQTQRRKEAAAAIAAAKEILAQAEQDESLAQDNMSGMRIRIAAKQKLLDEGLAELETKVEAITAPVKEQRAALASTQHTLQAEVDELRAQLASKEAELAASSAALAEVDAKVATLSAKYDRLRGQLAAEEADIKQQELQLKAAEGGAKEASAVAAAAREAASEQQRALEGETNKLGAWATERTSCAASLRLAAATEASRHKQLAALRTQEVDASTRLGELLSCLEALQQELADATGRRRQLLTEQAAVEDRMRGAQGRIPEVEAEKKAAAAKKDFKEAARLSAEAKALAASLDLLQADSRKLGLQLVEVDAKEEALAEQIKEMRGMQEELDWDVAEAQWRRLTCSCALLRDQLADAVSGERFEEAEGLEAELSVDAAEVERLQQQWGFQGDTTTTSPAVIHAADDMGREDASATMLEQQVDQGGGVGGEQREYLEEGGSAGGLERGQEVVDRGRSGEQEDEEGRGEDMGHQGEGTDVGSVGNAQEES